MAVGDFNGDGKSDVVVVYWSLLATWTGSVGVLLGNGDGTLQPPVRYGFPSSWAVTIGDFNGDGYLDIAVLTYVYYDLPQYDGSDFSTVSVFLGNGNGTFRPPVSYETGLIQATQLMAADVNGDGKLDLAVSGGGTIVLFGEGDGRFFPAAVFYPSIEASVVLTPSSLSAVAADFNRDGTDDLAVANVNGTVSVYLGRKNGTLRPPTAYASGGLSMGLAVGDFNGDGNLDLAVPNEFCADTTCTVPNGSVTILLGKGDGSFQPAVSYPSGALYATSVAVGDFNGDGKIDLAVANNCAESTCKGGTIGILLGNGDGTFQPAVDYPSGGATAISVVVGDFNRDGKLDLAVAAGCPTGGIDGCVSYLTSLVTVLIGNGDGTFQPAVGYEIPNFAPSYALAVGDFNNDGKLDLAVANSGGDSDCFIQVPCPGAVSLWLGNGDGTFDAGSSYDFCCNVGPRSIVVADFDGDGNADLAIANFCLWIRAHCDGSVEVLRGNGDGTFQDPLKEKINLIALAAGFFRNDDREDKPDEGRKDKLDDGGKDKSDDGRKGKPDLAGTFQVESGVTVLLNVAEFPKRTTK